MTITTDESLLAAFGRCFDNDDGEVVLEYLTHIVRRNSLDMKDPNPHQAIYRVAQEALLSNIENKLEEYKQL